MYFSIATGNLSGTIFLIRIPGFILDPSAHFGPSALAAYHHSEPFCLWETVQQRLHFIDTGFASAVTSSADHPPRSLTCVCFAKPSSLGVTEPFLTQKQPFCAVLSRSMFLANQAAQLVSGFLDAHPYDASGAARLLSQYPDTRVI